MFSAKLSTKKNNYDFLSCSVTSDCPTISAQFLLTLHLLIDVEHVELGFSRNPRVLAHRAGAYAVQILASQDYKQPITPTNQHTYALRRISHADSITRIVARIVAISICIAKPDLHEERCKQMCDALNLGWFVPKVVFNIHDELVAK